ncbi:hypothetical protein GY45DRAFT_1362911 [Cubamyces sp. BRFM 1775]|nr:hypothetical protein GY45DRAFT_1362911 [Cubamyces sp. BRFM 1775]
MAAEIRKLSFPLLLATPPPHSHDLASDSATRKYTFLMDFYYPATQHAQLSDLIDAIVASCRSLPDYRSRLDSDFAVCIYECEELPVPARHTQAGKRTAYAVIDDDWLEQNGDLLGVQPSLQQTLPMVQEVDESLGQIHREDIAKVAETRASPSSGATLSSRLQTQTIRRIDAVYNCRPLELTGPPITIYHTVFANFLKYMQEPRDFTPDELETAQNFVTQAAAYHQDENKRQEKLSPWMSAGVRQGVLQRTSITNSTGRFTPDGAMFAATETPRNGFRPLIGAHQLKAEIGEGAGDPSAQAENVYVAYYSSEEAQSIRERCCCPAILISSAGPNLQVSGAVFGDQFVVQNLGDPISVVPRPSFNGRSMLDDAGHRVAQLFYALRTCLAELDDYYVHLIHAVRSSHPVPLISPHFKNYTDERGKAAILTYKRRLVMEYPVKAVFVAEAKTDAETRDVVVKFTPAYNKDAHQLLTRESPPHAPELHYYEFVDSVGMWVVVMDYVKGKEVTGILQDPAHIASLKSVVTTLHANDFVFGGLRKPNLLLVEDAVVLIDFDWAAKSALASPPKLAAFVNAPLSAAAPPVEEAPPLEDVPEAGRRVPAGAVPTPDAPVALAPVPVPVEDPLDAAGATAAIFATLAHLAAEFVDASPCLYGMKETEPVLSSWTSAVIDAAYCALASLLVGPASVEVIEPSESSRMNANSCWTPSFWKNDAVWPWLAGKVAPPLAPG